MQKVVGGELTNYEIVGKGKHDLVILHGWGGSQKEWLPVAEGLKDRYRVIVVDLPKFSGDQGVYDYADWVEEFWQKVGVKAPVVLGYSFGGRLGIILAARGRVIKLILVDAAGRQAKTWKGMVIEMLKPVTRYLPQEIKNMIGSDDYKNAGHMRKVFVKVVNQDLMAEARKIAGETLIVWGENDQVLPVSEAKILRNAIKNSTLRIVWGGDHWPHINKKDDLIKILEEEGI